MNEWMEEWMKAGMMEEWMKRVELRNDGSKWSGEVDINQLKDIYLALITNTSTMHSILSYDLRCETEFNGLAGK